MAHSSRPVRGRSQHGASTVGVSLADPVCVSCCVLWTQWKQMKQRRCALRMLSRPRAFKPAAVGQSHLTQHNSNAQDQGVGGPSRLAIGQCLSVHTCHQGPCCPPPPANSTDQGVQGPQQLQGACPTRHSQHSRVHRSREAHSDRPQPQQQHTHWACGSRVRPDAWHVLPAPADRCMYAYCARNTQPCRILQYSGQQAHKSHRWQAHVPGTTTWKRLPWKTKSPLYIVCVCMWTDCGQTVRPNNDAQACGDAASNKAASKAANGLDGSANQSACTNCSLTRNPCCHDSTQSNNASTLEQGQIDEPGFWGSAPARLQTTQAN